MNTPGNIPNMPHKAPHTIQWARYARELLVASGVPTQEDELWRRLAYALAKIESRLTIKPNTRGKRFMLKGTPVKLIYALADQFQCSPGAVIRQLVRLCPPEHFPDNWVEEDTRLVKEREDHVNQIIAEQRQRFEEVL